MAEEKNVFDWDDEIENDGDGEFPVAPAGDYDFVITKVEKEWFDPKPGQELPACHRPKLTLRVQTADGQNINVFHRFYLCKAKRVALGHFFVCIGHMKPGETKRMEWDRVEGCRGRCKLIIDEWEGKKYNKVTFFFPPKEPTPEKEW